MNRAGRRTDKLEPQISAQKVTQCAKCGSSYCPSVYHVKSAYERPWTVAEYHVWLRAQA